MGSLIAATLELTFRRLGCALVVFAACTTSKLSDSRVPVTPRCSGDRNCQETQLCVFGVCSDACATSSDCTNLGSCVETGRGAACLRLEDNACFTAAECPASARCVAGRCVSKCEGRTGKPCLIGAPCSVAGCSPRNTEGAAAGKGHAGGSGAAGAVAPSAPFAAGAPGVGSLGCPAQTVRCVETERQQCDDKGVWHPIETCSTTCTPAGCVEPPKSSECVSGATRCDPQGIANLQICSSIGTWDAGATCPGGACKDGACSGECTPGVRRCDPRTASAFQICAAQRTWGNAQACPQGAACGGAGECSAAAMSCMPGQSPNWYTGAGEGGNPSLGDPRWGTEPALQFAGTFGFESGGYVIVFDRTAKQLAISLRVTVGSNEVPDARDYVYFAATPNISGAPPARSVRIPLIDLRAGEGPTPISQLSASAFLSSWKAEAGGWVQHVSAWRGGPNDKLSWAVNLQIDLSKIAIDLNKPFRIAVAAHAEGAARDLTTPADLGMLTDMPAAWARARVDPTRCVGQVVLE